MSSHPRVRLISETRPPPKEVFPEALGSNGLQPTTVLWSQGTVFHQRAHCCWQVDGRLKVFECRVTHKSDDSNHPLNDRTKHYWDVPAQSRNYSTPSTLSSTSERINSSSYPRHQHSQQGNQYPQQGHQPLNHEHAHAPSSSRGHRSSHSRGHPAPMPTDYFAPSHPQPSVPGYAGAQQPPYPPRDRGVPRESHEHYAPGYAQSQAAGTHQSARRSQTYATVQGQNQAVYDPRVSQSVHSQHPHQYLDAPVQQHYEHRARSHERYA